MDQSHSKGSSLLILRTKILATFPYSLLTPLVDVLGLSQ